MVQTSPRVFWNLARHYGTEIEAGLRTLLPEADWSFLNSRKRGLSEKAQRNAEQKAERNRQRRSTTKRLRDAAAVEDVDADSDESESFT
jgi:hypothetical protein